MQTPTLAMICRRFLENKNFTPVPFWQIKIQTEKQNIPFVVISREKYDNKDTANSIFGKLQGNSLLVQSVEKKEVNQEPPLLHSFSQSPQIIFLLHSNN